MNSITSTNLAPYPWQQKVWEQFTQWQAQGQLPHAMAICGPKGLGHQTLMWQIAKQLLCHHGTACMTCQSCHWWQAMTHPDWLTVTHEERMAGIKIDAVRSALNHIQQTPHTASRRLVLVHPAETMTLSAANALLKTLEEPPPHVLFLLISYQPQYVPITIMSRCQILTLTVPSLSATQQWLQQKSMQNAEQLARFSGGLPLLAQHMGDQALVRHLDIVQHLKQLAMMQTTSETLISKYSELALDEWLDHLQKIVEDAVRLRLGITKTLYWTEALNWLESVYCELSTEKLFAIRHSLNVMTTKIQQSTSLNYEATVSYLLLTSIGRQLHCGVALK